jgi:hypothetical protein
MKTHVGMMKAKKLHKGAHRFTIAVGDAAKAKQLRHEMKESPAKERMEEKLYKEHMKKKGKKKHGKK